MTSAIVIITFVAFIGRIAISAAAIRNWLVVTALTIAAGGVYALLRMFGMSIDEPVQRVHDAVGLPVVLVACAIMFAIGYGIPTMLRRADVASASRARVAFFIAVLTTFFGVHLWAMIDQLGLVFPYIVPDLFFSAGICAFLVFRSRFFEDDGGAVPEPRRKIG